MIIYHCHIQVKAKTDVLIYLFIKFLNLYFQGSLSLLEYFNQN